MLHKEIDMTKEINAWTHKELMALPVRKWDDEKEYTSLLIVSTRKKHDSGWAVIAIIGTRDYQPEEIAVCCCDDIEWKLPPMKTFGGGHYTIGQFRMDCALKSGALHVWQREARFKVGIALSSTTIELVPNAVLTGRPEKGREEALLLAENATVMQRIPCQEPVKCERVGGTDDQPVFAVRFCCLDEGHDGEHSVMHMSDADRR